MKDTLMKRMSAHLLLALGLALLAGCSASSDTGSAQFAVSLPQALSSPVSRVSVTASAADFSPLSVDLVFADGVWGGTLGNLPAGSHRSFLAQAFDASGTRLFQGSVSDVTISADQTSLIALTLQQVHAPPAFQNEAPVIDSLVAASSTATFVSAGSTLSLVATTHDPNPGDTLSYVWSSTAGAFSSTSEATTSWTAPASTGIQTLTFTVTDPGGLSSTVSLAVYVGPSPLPGHAQFSISFNTAPQVDTLSASLTRVAVGQMTSVSASASDVDGDSLTYSWSASCPGAWTQASSPSARFTPSTLPVGACNNCRLTVAVSDGRGGQTTGTVALCVSNLPAINQFNPVILSAFHTSDTAAAGQVLTFEVVANDPVGAALSFSWAAPVGVLGKPTTASTSSRISWTAPSCVRASAPPAVTATVTNAFNLKATQSFSVKGLPECGTSSWTSTGSMLSYRSEHTATRLLNGKVLVLGGDFYGQVAEVYDPASGTWSATGAMSAPRNHHTATLLPNGKVLVLGGYITGSGYLATTELYNPASGTWSSAGAMTSGRIWHTATRLLNGKVLVLGGTNASNNTYPTTAELYDPDTGTWSTTTALPSPRGEHTATLLPNGTVLVLGGSNRVSGSLATAEVYDPASDTWSTVTSMGTARHKHTATLLPNDKVLISGGFISEGVYLVAEVYDPTSGTWSIADPKASPRGHSTETLLLNGKVLVAGGYVNGSLSKTAELCTP